MKLIVLPLCVTTLLTFFQIFFSSPAFAKSKFQSSKSTTSKKTQRLKLFHFELGGIGALENGGGNSISAQLAYAPRLHLFAVFGFRPRVSGTLLNGPGNKKFWVTDYQAFLTIGRRFSIELGGGLQRWHGREPRSKILSANMILPRSRAGLISYFYLGYSYYSSKDTLASEFRAGFGL